MRRWGWTLNISLSTTDSLFSPSQKQILLLALSALMAMLSTSTHEINNKTKYNYRNFCKSAIPYMMVSRCTTSRIIAWMTEVKSHVDDIVKRRRRRNAGREWRDRTERRLRGKHVKKSEENFFQHVETPARGKNWKFQVRIFTIWKVRSMRAKSNRNIPKKCLVIKIRLLPR